MENINQIKMPQIGDEIYVGSSFYVYRGEDDFAGGLATISKVEISDHLPIDNINSIMVGIKERKSTMYNYKILLGNQIMLKQEYGHKIAHPDPDMHPDVNCSPKEGWR